MSNNEEQKERNEEDMISFSLRLELMAAIVGVVAEALDVWANLEAIEEEKIEAEEKRQAEAELNDRLEQMQAEIDELTEELAQIKQNESDCK